MRERIGVVFLSRRNSFRSVLAHACLSHLAPKRFSVHSCGQPGQLASSLHPAALGALKSAGITLPITEPHSWMEMLRLGAPAMDLVITLDASIEAVRPQWPGQPDAATWPYPDMASAGDPEEAAHGAIQTLYSLRRRLELLVNLPLRGADRTAVRSDIRDMAYMR